MTILPWYSLKSEIQKCSNSCPAWMQQWVMPKESPPNQIACCQVAFLRSSSGRRACGFSARRCTASPASACTHRSLVSLVSRPLRVWRRNRRGPDGTEPPFALAGITPCGAWRCWSRKVVNSQFHCSHSQPSRITPTARQRVDATTVSVNPGTVPRSDPSFVMTWRCRDIQISVAPILHLDNRHCKW